MIQIESNVALTRPRLERVWSDDTIRTARELAEAGKTASQIAKAIGRTRNAVVGMSHRGHFKLTRKPGFRTIFPFAAMNVGDSFVTDRNSVRSCAWQAQKRHGFRFTCRKHEGGIRVWRIA